MDLKKKKIRDMKISLCYIDIKEKKNFEIFLEKFEMFL